MDGIDLAALNAPEHAAAIRAMLPQLLIHLVSEQGGDIVVPAKDIDGTGGRVLSMQVIRNGTAFRFKVTKKQ